MRINEAKKKAYDRHAKYSSKNDGKQRMYCFEIENLEDDYAETLRIISKYKDSSFDFVASCLRNEVPSLRVFSKEAVLRFSIGKEVSLPEIKKKLIANGYVFAEKSKSEPFSAIMFRLKLPFWEFKMWLLNTLLYK